MTSRTLPIRGIFSRFFPRKYTALPQEAHQGWQELPNEQKEISALHFLNKGELALLQGNLNALSFFETAAQIAPENPKLWYRQGLAFFEYGSEEGKEKALLVASKHFKIAAELNPSYFEAYHAWGNSLLQLGKFHAESHFFYEAKEKYQKALELSSDHPKEVIA
ncbi:MAG: hypothetical protein FJZ64_04495, partial [Chlamydiae bacterium]|nr:hypothetical protein [Chlamydiota bacterium]